MKIRFGIIGLGSIANGFAQALKTVEDAQLTAAAAKDLGRAVEFADKYQAANAYGDYGQLINDVNVDVVYISTTHNSHYEITRQCLENGKAVLCEKPFTVNKAQARLLFNLSVSKHVLAMEAMWSRFLPCYRKAKEWVNSGRIGKLKLLTAAVCFKAPFDPENRYFNPDLAGGAILDCGVYPIEFAIDFAGEPPAIIEGATTLAKTGVDNFSAITLGFPNGMLAQLSCGFTAKTDFHAKIYGTDGYIILYDFIMTEKVEMYDEQGDLAESFEQPYKFGMTYEIRHFIELYKKGAVESDIMPWRDTLACAEVFDMMKGKVLR